jgi:hypothetical protein
MKIYRTTVRPVSIFTLPHGVRYELVTAPWTITALRPDLPRSQHRYGTFTTDRALTREEMTHFDIVESE